MGLGQTSATRSPPSSNIRWANDDRARWALIEPRTADQYPPTRALAVLWGYRQKIGS